jgi:hypothetical protein
MIRKFLNARSPLRLLEKGLHGGLGIGNLGVLLAGHGVGKTSFLVGVALDELLRGGTVLHVTLDQTVAHLRMYYDTVFEDLAGSTQLEDAVATHSEIDGRRSIRAYSDSSFSSSKLRDAVKVDIETGLKPSLILIEGIDIDGVPLDEFQDIRALAEELAAEVWFSVPCPAEQVKEIPAPLEQMGDLVSVILALEPAQANGGDSVALRALKDHENTDLGALHVSLDPKTLLLVRG